MSSSITDSAKYWLALHRLPQVGPVKANQLLEQFGDPSAIFCADIQILRGMLRAESIQVLQDFRQQGESSWLGQEVAADLTWLEQNQAQIISLSDPRYPPLLKQLHQPPIILYVQGQVEMLSQIQLAMVGSRRPTISGKENAYQFAKDLAQMGFVITSGLALGVDALCHQGALAGGGSTIAVMGSGLDHIYPRQHNHLAAEIIEQGVLVSEFPLRVAPQARNFPRRNRIISGLSVGTLVVEAAVKSGSLITAKYALEQNREIFAIPGSINNPMAKGCHSLIRQGAKLIESAQHIVEELELLVTQPEQGTLPLFENNIELEEDEKLIIGCIGSDPTSIDQISARSGKDSGDVASVMLLLELKGLVVNEDGCYQLTANYRLVADVVELNN